MTHDSHINTKKPNHSVHLFCLKVNNIQGKARWHTWICPGLPDANFNFCHLLRFFVLKIAYSHYKKNSCSILIITEWILKMFWTWSTELAICKYILQKYFDWIRVIRLSSSCFLLLIRMIISRWIFDIAIQQWRHKKKIFKT